MKVLILSNPESSHTIKWIKALSDKKVSVYLLSLNPLPEGYFAGDQYVQTADVGLENKVIMQKAGSLSKMIYLKMIPALFKAIKTFKPDIVHAHYASSYGILGGLSGFSPFVLSVWGSDVYRFPKKSFLHRLLVEYSLKKADKILSTSQVMLEEIYQYTSKHIDVTPFGIDTELFRPKKEKSDDGPVVIGTVKSLKRIYGIDVLIHAFKILVDRIPDRELKLLIVGGGKEKVNLEKLVKSLSLTGKVEFTGTVLPESIPEQMNRMDIFAALTVIEESFGVSVLEASACGKPVVVSNVSGFREIVKDRKTGFIVPKNDPGKAAEVLQALVMNERLRKDLGNNGRLHVLANYSLESSVEKMLSVYKSIQYKK
jgi:glycosyltransferase involved in cell wall biosynthesis